MKIEKNSQILIGIVVVIAIYFLLIAPKAAQEPRSGIIITAYDIEGNLLGDIGNYDRESNIFSRGDIQSVGGIYYKTGETIQLPVGTATVKFTVVVENTGNMPIQATYMGGLLEAI